MFVIRVIQSLAHKKVKFAIAGGWAVALHGAVRGTVDLDLVVTLTKENLNRAVSALAKIGLESRLPVSVSDVVDFREEFIRNKKMLAWRFVNPKNPAEVVDLLIIEDLRNLRTTFKIIGGGKVPIVTLDELIRMKRVSARPQDLEDVQALEAIKALEAKRK